MTQQQPATVGLVGVNGYGVQHLRALQHLREEGNCRLIAAADQSLPGPVATELLEDTPVFGSLDELLAEAAPDIVVLATPLHTHRELAEQAMRQGCHVLVEKPPTVSLTDFRAMLATAKATARACQVGFQANGSDAYRIIDDIVTSGEIGTLTGIGFVGTWLRPTSYYARSPWAGKRQVDGVPVVDGALTNPLAHAVAAALKIAHSTTLDSVADVEVELFHAHDIEADDTSSVRLVTTEGIKIAGGLTLCATEQTPARVIVQGTAGSITFYYTEDRLEVSGQQGARTIEVSAIPLLRNLADHIRDPKLPLLSGLEDTGSYMRVVEAVRTAPDPRPIPDEYVTWVDGTAGRHPVVTDIEQLCEQVASRHSSFAGLGAPWAQ